MNKNIFVRGYININNSKENALKDVLNSISNVECIGFNIFELIADEDGVSGFFEELTDKIFKDNRLKQEIFSIEYHTLNVEELKLIKDNMFYKHNNYAYRVCGIAEQITRENLEDLGLTSVLYELDFNSGLMWTADFIMENNSEQIVESKIKTIIEKGFIDNHNCSFLNERITHINDSKDFVEKYFKIQDRYFKISYNIKNGQQYNFTSSEVEPLNEVMYRVKKWNSIAILLKEHGEYHLIDRINDAIEEYNIDEEINKYTVNDATSDTKIINLEITKEKWNAGTGIGKYFNDLFETIPKEDYFICILRDGGSVAFKGECEGKDLYLNRYFKIGYIFD